MSPTADSLTNSLRLEDRRSISDRQLARLRTLLAALVPGNRFYSEKLRAVRIDPDASTLESFQRAMPFTMKQELVEDQRLHSPYGTNLTYPLERYNRFCQTSGTSGSPLRWLDTPESWDWMLRCWLEVYRAAGISSSDRLFFAFSFAPFLGFWTAFESAAKMGVLCFPGGGLSSVARLNLILDNAITVLCCTPTYALRLVQVAREEGIDLAQSNIAKIIVAGEPGGSIPGVRARIETGWPGSRVFDHHGATETGPVSYPCPKLPGVLHILESEYIAEIIDPQTGQPVGAGQTGELVLTNLGRLGSPLLRYRTGDLLRQAQAAPCDCGTYEMALQGGILGRTDDMVKVRGVNVSPSAVEEIVRACEGVEEYRMVMQTERELAELTLEIEPTRDCQDPLRLVHQVRRLLEKAFALRISVSVVPQGSLPRFEMKARRWVRL